MKTRPRNPLTGGTAIGLAGLLLLACTLDYSALGGRDGGGSLPTTDAADAVVEGGPGQDGGTAERDAMTPSGGNAGPIAGAAGTATDIGGLGRGGANREGSGGSSSGGASTGGAGHTGGATGGATGAAGASSTGGAPNGGGAGTAPGTGGFAMGGAAGSSDLALRYAFDETSGSVVHDTSAGAGGPHDGALATVGSGGSATFTTNKVVGTGALALQGQRNSAGGYVTAPSLAALAPQAVTLAIWINVPGGGANQRAFDFGTGTNKYIFLTPNDGMNRVRFAITANGRGGEQELHASTWTMSTPSWHHVAVVLPAGSSYSGTLYIDGVAAANNTAMSLHLSDLGETTGNYLGRSAFAADDYFNGALDDFRVYRRALSASEIAALYGAHE